MQQEQRRLAAILAADVAGYSRLMAADESGTVARLNRLRAEVIEPKVAQFQGRIVGSAGDSLLIEFASAVNAVRCAVAAQQALSQDNTGLPVDRRMEFRMGVNLGDVIASDGTIHGDGVNIAARLEKLAEPGGLCIARNVFDQVEGKLDLIFSDLGEHEAKNIAKPIWVYRAEIGGQPHAATKAQPGAKAPPKSEKVSIAVLPFDNMSGDPEQGYFSDGITEDIITGLSRFRELLVIARNSSFTFRGKSIDVKNVAQKLGVQFVVEGSVRKIGNRVRVTVQLIDAALTAHVWAERYDRDLTDIFEIQDEITRMVTTQTAGHAFSAAAQGIRARPTENLSAYDYFLKARELHGNYESMLRAEPFLVKAIELDPDFAAAHAMNSVLNTIKYFYDGKAEHLGDALISGRKAQDLDQEEPWANYAIALNPNDATFLAFHALWLNYVGRSDDAVREIDEALRRDPYAIDWSWDIRGIILTAAGKPREGIDSFNRMKDMPPWSLCFSAICHVEFDHVAEAQACLEKYKALNQPLSPDEVISGEPWVDKATIQRLAGALRRADQMDEPKAV